MDNRETVVNDLF